MSGLKVAALYGIWPHQLGFCGPKKKRSKIVLYQYLQGKEKNETKIRKILRKFEGAFAYYRLIAKSNDIKDPFDARVVRAYWISNGLLEKVKISDLKRLITENFSKPGLLPKEVAEKKAKKIPKGAVPHHSFHVLVVGSVARRILLEGKLLDLCRISWGRVIAKEQKLETRDEKQKTKIKVKYQPLIGNRILKLGKPIVKEIFWDKTLVPQIEIDDWVSFHWNHLVQKLSKKDIENLEKYTELTLKTLAKTK